MTRKSQRYEVMFDNDKSDTANLIVSTNRFVLCHQHFCWEKKDDSKWQTRLEGVLVGRPCRLKSKFNFGLYSPFRDRWDSKCWIKWLSKSWILGWFYLASQNRENQISRYLTVQKSNSDFDWIWIPRYLAVQIQVEIFVWFEFADD